MADPIQIIIEDDQETVKVDPVTGTVETIQPDGGVVVQLDAIRGKGGPEKFYANLVDKIDPMLLGQIADDLHSAIDADDRSRQEYLAIRARGLDLLGIKLEQPRSTVGESSAAADGLSSVTNPLLLEACLKGWANAQAEMLPANGPAKIRNDGGISQQIDDLAEDLERGFNHYLTTVATEYYPDTSHMLLWGVYFGGCGIKKIYRCPLRRRPVSESVDVAHFIVSDTTKDLRNCARITHVIPMRPSVMKRMVLIGAYRALPPTQPTPTRNAVESKIAGIQGTQAPQRPEDQPYTVWECQCELDIPQFAPGKFKDEGVPLPYLVTMDKDSREILAIRRDWNEDDDQCQRRRMYVKYPYVPGPGFYGTGLLNILGNCSAAMTAAWREALDCGMFANFPSGLIAKMGNRQNSIDIRLAPGTLQPIETGGQPIGNMVADLPYHDVTPGLMALMDKITAQAKQVGGVADMPTAEGIQNVPVGTMMAQIEQATKVTAAAHKGMHQAQSEEFELLLDLFRQNPEDFYRGNKDCKSDTWNEQRVLQAIDQCPLVPVSDPNVPSHLHRLAKAVALSQLILNQTLAAYMNPKETLQRILRAIREDESGLIVDPPPPSGEPPLQDKAKMLTATAQMKNADAKIFEAQSKGAREMAKAQAEKEAKTLDLADSIVVHQADMAKLRQAGVSDIAKNRREDLKLVQQQRNDDRSFALDTAKHQEAVRDSVQEARLRAAELLQSSKKKED